MTTNGQGAPNGVTPPDGGTPNTTNTTPWYGNDFAQLVTTKAWKAPDDVIKSYQQLETHLGAPADRLIRLPDPTKIDDTFRADVLKRIGYEAPRAPEKPEDYGVQVIAGTPPEYGSHMAQAAHAAGITKSQMDALVKAQNEFGGNYQKTALEAETKQIGERIKAADTAIAERFGAKAPEMQEAMLREAVRLGIKAEDMAEIEKDLAASDRLGIFRNLLADVAEARMESPLHKGADNRMGVMPPEKAQETLAAKQKDPDWRGKALTRGTPEAEENVKLNALAQGIQLTDAAIARLAKGLTAEPAPG